jgi:hypothetical protein
MDYEDYEKDTSIDEQGLDVEWLQQPSLMAKYGKHAAQVKLVMDRYKEELDVVKAQLDRDIRMTPDNYGLNKLTETIVSNTIIIQPEYKYANDQYSNAKYEYDIAMAAVRAIDQKKTALENLVRLHGQQYFAGPSVPRDLSKEYAKIELQKQTNKKITLRRKK